MPRFCCGQSTLQFKCPLEGISPFGQRGRTFTGAAMSHLSVKGYKIMNPNDLQPISQIKGAVNHTGHLKQHTKYWLYDNWYSILLTQHKGNIMDSFSAHLLIPKKHPIIFWSLSSVCTTWKSISSLGQFSSTITLYTLPLLYQSLL